MNSPIPSEEAIFQIALEMPVSDRAAYLAQACGDDNSLRQRVEQLLAAHEDAAHFMQTNEGDNAAARTIKLAPHEKPSDRIGRYKLLQEIGTGGFGTVWMAEQTEPVTRRVALKIIKLGMDTREVVARFEAERQALAMMDHPNIAKVFDVGATDAGRPYFVMELVRGVPITKYCDDNNLSSQQRLALFVQVCNAIHHAHQKGIIHRDIKPSNILVTLHDGVPVPKVIDFGIAKATDQRLTDKTLFTQFQTFMGTPAYTSPEQAEMSGLDIDTRADIYSLGVLLYELLTGQPPFNPEALAKSGLDEMRRTIREVEPPRPSTALNTMNNAALTTVAKHRGTEAGKLSTLLRGDLDWIVMKALEKNRTRRYESASAFAQDVGRHLNNEAVVARPPSAVYLLQKLVRRHKLAFVAGSAVVVTLVLGLSLSTWMLLRERKAHEAAAAAMLEAERAKMRTVSALKQVEAEKTATEKALAQTKIAKEAAEKAQANEVKQREKAELSATVANLEMFSSASELEKMIAIHASAQDRAMFFSSRLEFWHEGHALAKPALAKYPKESRVRFQFTQILGALSNACFESGETAEARARAKERLDANTDTKEWHYGNVISEANQLLGRVELREGHVKEAGGYLLKAGQTPGSPQLDSFGPSFALARELLAAGEKQVVLDYLDLVEKFMVKKGGENKSLAQIHQINSAFLQKSREDIRAGRTPEDAHWLQ